MESGWNLWVWLVGMVRRKWVWLVGMVSRRWVWLVGMVSRRWVWLVGMVSRRWVCNYCCGLLPYIHRVDLYSR